MSNLNLSLQVDLATRASNMLAELVSAGMDPAIATKLVTKHFGESALAEISEVAESSFGKGQRKRVDDGLVVGRIYQITECCCDKARAALDSKGLSPVWTQTYSYKGKDPVGLVPCNHIGQLVRVTKVTPQGRKRKQMAHDRHRALLLLELPSVQNPSGAEHDVHLRQFAEYHKFKDIGSWVDPMIELGKATDKATSKATDKATSRTASKVDSKPKK